MLYIPYRTETGPFTQSNSPKAPSAPGEPGIVIHFDGNQWPSYDLYRVFARMSTSPAKWQYVGLYKSKILPPWSPEEVTNQPRLVRLLSFVTASDYLFG